MATKKTSAKKTATKKTAKKTAAKKTALPAHFATDSSKAAYDHFLPLAKKVPAAGLDVCRADLAIARVNIDLGIAALTPVLAEVKKKLPHCPLGAVLELPALALAARFAAGKMVAPASTGEIEQRFADMRPMREAALKQLEIFAVVGLLPPGVPAAIRKGTGSLDHAGDAVAIASVFHDHQAAFDGKHPFTKAMLKKLGEDGDWLLKHLKPAGAKEAPTERDPASIVRDQMWAMIVERHEQLRQAGAVVFGTRDLDGKIPPLGARVVSSNAKKDEAQKDEANKDDAKKDDAKAEGAKKDEAKKDDTKAEGAKAEG